MRVLLFGTCYVDTLEKSKVLQMWMNLALRNKRQDLDILIVDSSSPQLPYIPLDIGYHTFRDNIGHLSRGGKDGWGRAFSYGLFRAMALDYEYVVHVECDSLLLEPVQPTLSWMKEHGISVASTRVSSAPRHWVETGLMFFDVRWIQDTDFLHKYDWERRTKKPEPEVIIKGLTGTELSYIPWNTMRDDHKELTVDNLRGYDLQWLTHAPLDVMEKFYAKA